MSFSIENLTLCPPWYLKINMHIILIILAIFVYLIIRYSIFIALSVLKKPNCLWPNHNGLKVMSLILLAAASVMGCYSAVRVGDNIKRAIEIMGQSSTSSAVGTARLVYYSFTETHEIIIGGLVAASLLSIVLSLLGLLRKKCEVKGDGT